MTASLGMPAFAGVSRVKSGQNHKSGKPIQVCVLSHDGLCPLEYGIANSVFSVRNSDSHINGGYGFCVLDISESAHSNLSPNGGRSPDYSVLSTIDIIVIPGWKDVMQSVPSGLKDALCAANARGARIAVMGTGVFLLAACGLLDGKRVTTHWRYLDEFQMRYPNVTVDTDVLFVEDQNILSSAGGISGLDMCIHIVRADFGATVANVVARRMVMHDGKGQGQSKFISRSLPRAYQGNLAPLLDKIRESISEDWGIERMAQESRSSARTLQRRFKDATGHSPHMWLTIERIEFAKDLLETTSLHVQQIANVTGLKTPETFRHHFKRLTGISPTRFRSQFTSANDIDGEVAEAALG